MVLDIRVKLNFSWLRKTHRLPELVSLDIQRDRLVVNKRLLDIFMNQECSLQEWVVHHLLSYSNLLTYCLSYCFCIKALSDLLAEFEIAFEKSWYLLC